MKKTLIKIINVISLVISIIILAYIFGSLGAFIAEQTLYLPQDIPLLISLGVGLWVDIVLILLAILLWVLGREIAFYIKYDNKYKLFKKLRNERPTA